MDERPTEERPGLAGVLPRVGGSGAFDAPLGGHFRAPDVPMDSYVAAIVEVAERDASIARVLREICALDGAVRSGALDLVGAHLRTRIDRRDVFECLDALRRDDVARRIAERLGPPR